MQQAVADMLSEVVSEELAGTRRSFTLDNFATRIEERLTALLGERLPLSEEDRAYLYELLVSHPFAVPANIGPEARWRFGSRSEMRRRLSRDPR